MTWTTGPANMHAHMMRWVNDYHDGDLVVAHQKFAECIKHLQRQMYELMTMKAKFVQYDDSGPKRISTLVDDLLQRIECARQSMGTVFEQMTDEQQQQIVIWKLSQ